MMIEAKKILSGISKKYQIEKKASETKVLDAWNNFIAVKFPVKTRATSFSFGVLHIVVEKPTWVQELTILKALLIEELNKICDTQTIKDVRLYTGDVNEINQQKSGDLLEEVHESERLDIVPEEQYVSRMEKESKEIRDDELRLKFARLRAKNFKYREKMYEDNHNKCVICREYDVVENKMCSNCFKLCDDNDVIWATDILNADVTLNDQQIMEKNPSISLKGIRVARLIVSNYRKEMLLNYIEHNTKLDLEKTEFIWRLAEEYIWARFSQRLREIEEETLIKYMGIDVVDILRKTKID